MFSQLGYQIANCFCEQAGTADSTLGRETTGEIVLAPKLRAALMKLNSKSLGEAIDWDIDELPRDRGAVR